MALGKNKAGAPTVVVALTGGIYAVKGTKHVVHPGERLDSTHPLVKARPAMFAADGLTEREMQAAKAAYDATKQKPRDVDPRRWLSPYKGLRAQDPIVRVDDAA